VNLRPDQLGTKLSTIKDAYQLFRFVDLRIKSVFSLTPGYPTATAIGASHAVAWSGEYLANNPAFFDAMAEFPRMDLAQAYHPATIKLSRRELVGEDPLKWFRTDEDEPSGTAAEDFTTQGYMYWASYIDNGGSTGSFRHLVLIEGLCEFCQPKNTALDVAGPHVPPVPVQALKSFDSANVVEDIKVADEPLDPQDQVVVLHPGADTVLSRVGTPRLPQTTGVVKAVPSAAPHSRR